MFRNQTKPIVYLITEGSLTNEIAVSQKGFKPILDLISSAVLAKVSLIQIREKNLSANFLYELTKQAAKITHKTETRLLVNDRADIALAANADGVNLTTLSLRAEIIRKHFSKNFIIGVSTHSIAEAMRAKENGADFALLGPIFDTPSKRQYGSPLGLDKLKEVSETLCDFPVIGIGGVALENARQVFQHGASGIAAIRLLNDAENLKSRVLSIQKLWREK